MDVKGMREEPDFQPDEPRPQHKLDLAYFTEPNHCPLMVRRGARSAFELFLWLAHRFLEDNGEPVLVDYKVACVACGLDPENIHSRSSFSRLFRSLLRTFRVIDFEPVKRRQPQVRLAPPRPGGDILNPRHYIYVEGGWNQHHRAIFEVLGTRAFAAEYMYWIAQYESALARIKHGRPYWFFPLEKISGMYHVSPQFAGGGLRGLVELGIMRVMHGQYGIQARNDEFGAANRYYFEGIGEPVRRAWQFGELQREYETVFDTAKVLALVLTNGQTAKNVRGLCELITAHGEDRVRRVVERISSLPTRSLKRRLAYLTTVVSGGTRK
jgi:hypothetical protein